MNYAVVGAGPAGLVAAIFLAASGQSVTVVDEQVGPGGHLHYDHYDLRPGRPTSSWLDEVRNLVIDGSIQSRFATVAWAAFRTKDGIELSLNHAGENSTLSCERLVVATGTTDLPLNVPGASLPGVMTARGLRTLLNVNHVAPGRRFAVVGSGSEAERLTRDLFDRGLDVPLTIAASDIRAIEGSDHVHTVADQTGNRTVVDCVALAIGEAPDFQLARMIGSEATFDAERSAWFPAAAASSDDVWIVGGARSGFADLRSILAHVSAQLAPRLPEGDHILQRVQALL